MPSAKRVVWAPTATKDLWKIWGYYARVGSPEVADKIVDEIMLLGETLRDRHQLGRKRDELVSGLRSMNVQSHTVFYRASEAGIEIARVLHERRNFPELFFRARP